MVVKLLLVREGEERVEIEGVYFVSDFSNYRNEREE
jgi:hypothetical protein